MPNYEYKCKSCLHTKEVYQSIKDKPLTICPNCKEQTFERVIHPANVHYKGTGWHVTDYKPK